MKDKMILKMIPVLILLFLFCHSGQKVSFLQKENQIDVLFNGHHFTSYLFTPDLTKPILHPVHSPSGIKMNRSFPLETVDGESRDHPHHTGLFFTYDEVNEDGFWGNTTPPPEIKHIKATRMIDGSGEGILSTILHWIGKNGKIILEENRKMIFYPGKIEHIIDFSITLTARDTTVVFHDTKEGLFAIRVAHWLREKEGSGRYLSSNGDETEENIWGKRASWVKLEGKKGDKTLGIAILNHPQSTNYPTYWHARGYGLFSANPLGQFAFQTTRKVPNPQQYNLTLKKKESAVFIFRMVIYEGQRSRQYFDDEFKKYANQSIQD